MMEHKQYIKIGSSRRLRKRIVSQSDTSLQRLSHDDELTAGYCSRAIREVIRHYDHHVVEVRGRKGVLFTFHLNVAVPADRNLVVVVFDGVEKYPSAPPRVQQVIDSIA
uniref:Uncharacterized protein n=1 Tax=Roseihalotalea indica TaxID=2867963 RepID=A0AA49JEL2_9BACT|nr:hypothetical protein K4G66_16820 [Tunicatimonas sp. TK19036]